MLDHVAIPLRWCDAVCCASPIHAIGRKLQVIPSREHRDHIPVLVRVQVLRWGRGQQHQHVQAPDGLSRDNIRWDRDKMMQGVRGGPVREAFLQE
eukprot:2280274-Pyramimonas_sp.AAC.1